jgi:septal ring factor EnvC (AmiA/AmiB activator)
MRYAIILVLLAAGACQAPTQKLEEQLQKMRQQAGALDSILRYEAKKLQELDTLVNKEFSKVKELDSLVNREKARLDSLSKRFR